MPGQNDGPSTYAEYAMLRVLGCSLIQTPTPFRALSHHHHGHPAMKVIMATCGVSSHEMRLEYPFVWLYAYAEHVGQ